MSFSYLAFNNIRFEEWREQAACNSWHIDPEMFFPLTGHGKAFDRAVRVCRRCPVQSECLEHATTNRYTDGVWGGRLFGRGKNNE